MLQVQEAAEPETPDEAESRPLSHAKASTSGQPYNSSRPPKGAPPSSFAHPAAARFESHCNLQMTGITILHAAAGVLLLHNERRGQRNPVPKLGSDCVIGSRE